MPAAVETMMYSGETPWHKEGTPVPSDLRGDEVDHVAGLDWTLSLKKIQVGGGKAIDGYRAVVRSSDGKALSVVSEDYSILQNQELRTICDEIVGVGGAHFHTAGALNGGQDVWYLLSLPGEITLPGKGDQRVGKFLLGTTNHAGKRKARILPTPVRVVCANTVRLALSQGKNDGVSITHIGDLAERIAKAKETVKMALGYYTEFEQVANRLARSTFSDAQIQALAASIFPAKKTEGEDAPEIHWLVKKQRDRLVDLFENGKGHEGIRGTAWAALNAVAEWTDWERGTDDNRMDSAWFGDGARIKQRAHQLIEQQISGQELIAA